MPRAVVSETSLLFQEYLLSLSTDLQRNSELLILKSPVPCEVGTVEFVDPDDQELHSPVRPSTRTELLGTNPRERRAEIRKSMELGFYISLSGKRKIKTLHLLGTCVMVPTIDYFFVCWTLDAQTGQTLTTCARCVLIEVSLQQLMTQTTSRAQHQQLSSKQ